MFEKYVKNEKLESVKPIMKNLFKGYESFKPNTMMPSILYDDDSYLISFMVISDNRKFIRQLQSKKILDVELGFYYTNEYKLGLIMIFNNQFRFECLYNAKEKLERRTIYEAFEMSSHLFVWNLDARLNLLRVQKVDFDFQEHIKILNRYLLHV